MSETTVLPISPATQALIDLCLVVHDPGSEQWPDLERMVHLRQEELQAAWEAFEKEIEAEGEAVEDTRRSLVEAVEAQFLAYSQALGKIEQFGSHPDHALLEDAAVALAEASPALLRAQSALAASILTAGSSHFSTINLFDNLARRLVGGRISLERWRAACAGHQQFYTGVLAEIDASAHATDPGVPERRAAAESIRAAVVRLEGLTASSSAADFEEALQQLLVGHLAQEAALVKYNRAVFAGPTASVEANQVLFAAREVQAGRIPVEILNDVAAKMLEHVRRSLTQVHAAARLAPTSAVAEEEIPRTLEAMEALEDALGFLRGVTDPAEDVEFALSSLQDAVERVAASAAQMRAHDETFGKTICPHCGAFNPAHARTCETCKAMLPQFTGSDIYGTWAATSMQVAEGAHLEGSRGSVVTRSMKALSDACEQYENGKLGPEAFLALLAENEANVRKAEARLQQLKLPDVPEEATDEEREKAEEFLAMGGDAIGLLAQGVAECQAGLQQLERYVQTDQVVDMREGLRQFFEGCQKLLQIELVARTFVAALPPIPETSAEPQGEGADSPP